jgi:hypothetical protein
VKPPRREGRGGEADLVGRPGEGRPRRFTLLDATVLVAMCALGIRAHQALASLIAQARLPAGLTTASTVLLDIRSRGFLAIPLHVTFWFEIAMPWVLTLSLSLIVLRLIPPRPRRSQLSRQPGFVAMATVAGSALVAWACWLVLILPLQMSRKLAAVSNWDYDRVFFAVTLVAIVGAGLGVAVSWTMLLILRRSRAKADWIERAGIVLGVILIISLPFYLWDSLLYP